MIQLASTGEIYRPTSGDPVDLGYFNGTNFFFGWSDNRTGAAHKVGSYYSVPSQNVGMTPIWDEQQKATVTLNVGTAGTYTVDSFMEDNSNAPEILVEGGIYQRPADSSSGSYSVTASTGTFNYSFIYPDSFRPTIDRFRSNAFDKAYATKIDLSGLTNATSITMPDYSTESGRSLASNMSLLEEFLFPPYVQGVESSDFLRNCPKLKSITFPQGNCTIVDFYFLQSSGDTSDPAESLTIPNNITVIAPYAFLSNCNVAKNLTLACRVTRPSGYNAYDFVIPEVVEELHLTGYM